MTRPIPGADGPPPTVAIMVPSFDRGGLEQVALNLYRGYRALGWRCVVMVERNLGGYMLGQLESPAHGIVLNGEERLFLETIAEWGVDVLHYHYASLGIETARAMGIYTLYTLHNVYAWLDDAGFAHHARRVLMADRVVAVSAWVRRYFCARAGCGADRVDVIPNGVDLERLTGQAAPLPPLGLPPGRFVFALPASFYPVKHHPLALRAAERLLSRRRDFQLVFLGNVGEEAYADHVMGLIAASPARGHVSVLPCLDPVQMGRFYREVADCVLLPSLQEGCSNVVLEALAFDRPMILTEVGNAREAARMSRRVRVIPATAPAEALCPARIAELSRRGDADSLPALVEAMAQALAIRGDGAGPDEMAERHRLLGLGRMVGAYHALIAGAAPLVAGVAAPAPGTLPYPPASPATTVETLA